LTKVGFIGLGVMGFPMAGHLVAAKHDVIGYNRSPERARKWCNSFGSRSASTIAEAVAGREVVITCVSSDADLDAVAQNAFASMMAGSVFVDHSTVSDTVSHRLAAIAADRGIGYVDAPVSGGQIGAEAGSLSIMCGGSEADFASIQCIISTYAKICRLLGPVGSGQLAKMANQIIQTGIIQSLSEGLIFAERTGLDPKAVVEVIQHGSAGSWHMTNRHLSMLDGRFDFGFSVDLMRKDLGLCLIAASKVGAMVPVLALVDQFYQEIQSMGGGDWDCTALISRLRSARSSELDAKPQFVEPPIA
jgi:3-hydroxyisobutyrate dehydrogenase